MSDNLHTNNPARYLSKKLSETLSNYGNKVIGHSVDNDIFYCDILANDMISSQLLEKISLDMCIESNIVFKLIGVSGIVWEDSKNAQRVRGKVFSSAKELSEYEQEMELAVKYDHKVLGRDMGLFTHDPHVFPGVTYWLTNGLFLYEKIKSYLREVTSKYGYNEISTPPYASIDLWKKSGHWEMYQENMISFNIDEKEYVLKPMNCPLHAHYFSKCKFKKNDLPIKFAEFGFCHRNEKSGALNGLKRLRGFTQDDAHVFCLEEHIEKIILDFCIMLKQVYKKFGFTQIRSYLSTRPEKFIGEKGAWDKAESSLQNAAHKAGLDLVTKEGDGAFYGPKIDFQIVDNRGREWQCGTAQLDFHLAKRLDAEYESEDGKMSPIIIHHAILGSIERFLAILLENTRGDLPFWLKQTQVAICPINTDIANISAKLNEMNIRYLVYDENSRLGDKISRAHSEKIPIIIIFGEKELKNNTLSVRMRNENLNMTVEKFYEYVQRLVFE